LNLLWSQNWSFTKLSRLYSDGYSQCDYFSAIEIL
jgi:hypothetical protein